MSWVNKPSILFVQVAEGKVLHSLTLLSSVPYALHVIDLPRLPVVAVLVRTWWDLRREGSSAQGQLEYVLIYVELYILCCISVKLASDSLISFSAG